MAKSIFTSKKSKLELIKSDNNTVLIFIQDDTYFPSKICSVKLNTEDIKKLINTLTSHIQ